MKFLLTIYAILFSLLLLLAHEWQRLPDGNLHVQLLNIGQGDSILITTPGRQRLLIDGGEDLTLLERLGEELPFLNRRIDLLVLTHADKDHITALPEVLRRYDVGSVLMTGIEKETSLYRAFTAAIEDTNTHVIIANANHDLDLGQGVTLDILWPLDMHDGREVKNHNDKSIVAKLVWKDHEVLLTGDIEKRTEEKLLAAGINLSADILKVAHHGSKTSSSTGFLLATQSQLALISVGKENRFGHPHQEVVDRLAEHGMRVMRTDKERVEVVLK